VRADGRPHTLLGTVDLLILKALTWGPLHGHGIADLIQRVTGNIVAVGESTLYPALHRLQGQGWVKARWGVSKNNRRAKYYSLTTSGRGQLKNQMEGWRRHATAVCGALALQVGPVQKD
jgi:PadR family transcriptional regulator PadR